MAALVGPAEATPTTRLLVEIRPSFAPSVAARNQPVRFPWCNSLCFADFSFSFINYLKE
jgi:hypothetical protein